MDNTELLRAASSLAAGLCMGLGAIGSAVGEGYAAGYGGRAISKRPDRAGMLVRHMLIGQAVSETAGIFALVLAMLFAFSSVEVGNEISTPAAWTLATAFIGGGLAMGISAIGAGTGNGMITGAALETVATVPSKQNRVMIVMFISQALGQTQVIFGLLIAFFLKYKVGTDYALIHTAGKAVVQGACLLGAGISAGAGAIGPSIGVSIVGMAAASMTGRYIENRAEILRTFFIGGGVAQSCGVFAFVVALLLVFI